MLMPTYDLSSKDVELIDNNFTYHKPFGDQQVRYQELRTEALGLAEFICTRCPNSRERSLALTNLEQAIFWANASIARNEKESDNEVDYPDKNESSR